MRVRRPNNDKFDSRRKQRVYARRRSAGMATGLKGDDGCAHAIEFALCPADGDGRRLRMSGPRALVGCRCNDVASRVEENAADGRIGRCGAGPRPCDI